MAATPPPGITPAPTPAPQRGQRATFSGRVDAFVTWLTAAVAQFVALATNVYDNAVAAFGSATASAQFANDAAQQAGYALSSAANAAAAVTTAATINGATMWASGTTYQQFSAAVSKINYKTYRKTTTAAANTGGLTDPANDPTNWIVVGATTLPRSARTANAPLAQKDMGSLVDVSGTFTQTFDPVSNLGPGWYCFIKNSGTGDITLDADGAETIDGLTSFIMYPGEARLVQCDGVTLRSLVITPFFKTYISTAGFAKPPGYNYFGGIAWSGGLSGARSGSVSVSAPGGHGGGAFPFTIPAARVGATETVTIGAGGDAVTGTSTAGNPGGATTFGALVSVAGADANGGGGIVAGFGTLVARTGSSAGQYGAAAGFGAGDSQNAVNTVWGGASAPNSGFGGGSSVHGGAAGGGCRAGDAAYPPGTSTLGGNGGAASVSGNGADGVAPAGGGGATQTGARSGAGARGELRIWGIV